MDEGLELAQYTMIDFRHGTKVTNISNIYVETSSDFIQIVKMNLLHFTFIFFTSDYEDEYVTFNFPSHFFTSNCEDEGVAFYFHFLYIIF